MAAKARGNAERWLLILGLPLALVVITGLLYLALTYPIFRVASDFNVPTLLKGELLVTYGSKVACGSVAPAAGDIVVYQREGNIYVHRLLGAPGDRIQFKNGVPLINDRPTSQQIEGQTHLDFGGVSTKADLVRETLPNGRSYRIALADRSDEQENTPITILGPGQYFLAGDSRDNALDSRFNGPIPKTGLCAIAVRIFSSPDSTRVWKAL